MIRNTNSKTVERRLNINGCVLLKKAFENNTRGRRNDLHLFLFDKIYIVTKISSNNMIQIKNKIIGEIHDVFEIDIKLLKKNYFVLLLL
jgi:hypothetical protein